MAAGPSLQMSFMKLELTVSLNQGLEKGFQIFFFHFSITSGRFLQVCRFCPSSRRAHFLDVYLLLFPMWPSAMQHFQTIFKV